MRLLICGGREYTDYKKLCSCMDQLPFKPSIIIEGGARGADSLAKRWAIAHRTHYAEVPALWSAFGKRAGTLRNAAMLDLYPGYCIALPGGTGTADMVERCKAAGIPVWEISD